MRRDTALLFFFRVSLHLQLKGCWKRARRGGRGRYECFRRSPSRSTPPPPTIRRIKCSRVVYATRSWSVVVAAPQLAYGAAGGSCILAGVSAGAAVTDLPGKRNPNGCLTLTRRCFFDGRYLLTTSMICAGETLLLLLLLLRLHFSIRVCRASLNMHVCPF